ncbi:hypothetical protein EJB05_02270, partial [Eragrostis curvula]
MWLTYIYQQSYALYILEKLQFNRPIDKWEGRDFRMYTIDKISIICPTPSHTCYPLPDCDTPNCEDYCEKFKSKPREGAECRKKNKECCCKNSAT